MSAELAYRWLFALFPFGLFLAALGAFVAAWMGIQNPAQQIIKKAVVVWDLILAPLNALNVFVFDAVRGRLKRAGRVGSS